MDVMLQRHCARYIYVVPDGLRELMSDISREVLRSQPEDIHTFIADYLDALLITRENARISAKFVQFMTETAETVVDMLTSTGISKEEALRVTDVTQEAFKAWSDRKGILKEDDEMLVARIIEQAGISEAQVQAAALVIQTAFKTYKLRQQREAQLLTGIIDWRVAARSAIRLYRRTGVSPEEAKRAANLIKAAYKGYYTRRAIRLLNESPVGTGGERQDEFSVADDSYSISSSFSLEARKSKGVRIDYSSVIPHVDFGGEELISRDLTSILEEESEGKPQPKDVMMRIFGDALKTEQTSEEFIRELLEERILNAIGIEEPEEQPILEERDSETDVFVPAPLTDESQVPEVNRSMLLPAASQDQLEQELQEARNEMVKLQQQAQQKQVEEAEKMQGQPSELPLTGSMAHGPEEPKEQPSQGQAEEMATQVTEVGEAAPQEEASPEETPIQPVQDDQTEPEQETPIRSEQEAQTELVQEIQTEPQQDAPTESEQEAVTEPILDEPTQDPIVEMDNLAPLEESPEEPPTEG